MAFFQSTIRQEGFHPETASIASPDHHLSNSYFNPASKSNMDFTDELASLMPIDTSHERSTHHHEGEYRPHNIFDTSSFDYHSPTTADYANGSTTRAFNSTLPALNSSMRYEPQPGPESPYSATGFNRQTPSPHSQQGAPQTSRSRSRSRPPSGGAGGNTGSIGPQRTTRTRRNNSVSGTSPPPTSYHNHHYGRPQAIVIPGRNNSTGGGPGSNAGTPISPLAAGAGAWFGGNASAEYMPSDMHHHSHSSHSLHLPSLPHHSHPHQAHFSNAQQYSGFGMSPTETHLPPVSALHPGSLPKGLDSLALGTPTTSGLPSSLPNSHPTGTSPRGGSFHQNHTNERSPRSASVHAAGTSPSARISGGSAQEKQLLLASEKRRRRRESHNAVERRRRDNINEKISELATLIPECMLEGGSADAPGPANMGLDGTPLTSAQQSEAANGAQNGSSGENGSGLTLAMDSPTMASPTSPLSLNPLNEDGSVDLWGDLSMSGNSAQPKKEPGLDGLAGLYPIGEDAGAENAPGSPSTTSPTTASANAAAQAAANGVKANKGMILRKSVEYIRYLQQLVSAQGVRNRELEAELRGYRQNGPYNNSEFASNSGGMGMGVGMGGAGMGIAMGMGWGFSSPTQQQSQPSQTNGHKRTASGRTAKNQTTADDQDGMDEDGDRESPLASGTSPSAGSTDHDDSSSLKARSKKIKEGDEDKDGGDGDRDTGLLNRGRKRTTKFANGNGNGTGSKTSLNSVSASPPTNRNLRTRNVRGKAVTSNGHANGDDAEMSDLDDDEQMEM